MDRERNVELAEVTLLDKLNQLYEFLVAQVINKGRGNQNIEKFKPIHCSSCPAYNPQKTNTE